MKHLIYLLLKLFNISSSHLQLEIGTGGKAPHLYSGIKSSTREVSARLWKAWACTLASLPPISNATGTRVLGNPILTALVHFTFSSSISFTIWKCPLLPSVFLLLKASLRPSFSLQASLTTAVPRNPSFKFMALILCCIQLEYNYIYL